MCTVNPDLIIEEIEMRNTRASNLMIYNVEESNAAETADRIEIDKVKVKEIFELLQVKVCDDDIKRVSRVGFKRVGNKKRPIKIIFHHSDKVKQALRAAYKLKSTQYGISPDRTRIQMEHFKKLNDELKIRKENGESDLEMKFYNGIPRLVNKTQQRKN